MIPRKSLSLTRVKSNGDEGALYLALDLKLFHWVAIIVGDVALITATALGCLAFLMPSLSKPVIREWWASEQGPKVESRVQVVDTKVESYRSERMLQFETIHNDIKTVKEDVAEVKGDLKTLIQQHMTKGR